MTTVQVSALIAVAIWMAVLSIVVLLCVRQIALISTQLGQHPVIMENDGPEIGTDFAQMMSNEVPVLLNGESHLLLLSASCKPCHDLASMLNRIQLPAHPIAALVPGRPDLADLVVDVLPAQITPIRDPDATDLARAMSMQRVPSAVTFDQGVVTAKMDHIASAGDLEAFLHSRSTSPASGI